MIQKKKKIKKMIAELTTEFYPEDEKSLYYVKYNRWSSEKKTRWTLFQRQFMYPQEDWDKMEHGPLDSNEVHPWNLGEGIVNENPYAMDMNTKLFLKFMVDALNEKALRLKEMQTGVANSEKSA